VSTEADIEGALRDLLARRDPGKTVCPSEVARALGSSEEEWRALMAPVRRVASRLADAGEVEWTQRGRRVDPATVRGPVRLRRASSSPA
jgi:uncharacterized phage protein gp47/JayE